MELEGLANLLRHILDVGFIALRDDDDLDARAMRSQDLLLQTTDRKHSTTERDLARHRYIPTYRAVCHLGYERSRDRDSGRGSILWNRARWHVNVGLDCAQSVARNSELGGIVRRVGKCRTRRFFHDIAELTRKNQ